MKPCKATWEGGACEVLLSQRTYCRAHRAQLERGGKFGPVRRQRAEPMMTIIFLMPEEMENAMKAEARRRSEALKCKVPVSDLYREAVADFLEKVKQKEARSSSTTEASDAQA